MPRLAAEVDHPEIRPPVDHRILQLVNREGNAGVDQRGELSTLKLVTPRRAILPSRMRSRSTSAASIAPGTDQSHQKNCTRSSRSTPSRFSERSMIAHGVGAASASPACRGRGRIWCGSGSAARARVGAAEIADHLLDAGIVIGAVEGRDAGFDEGRHVAHRLIARDRAVAAGEVPAALEEAGDRIAGLDFDPFDRTS